MLAPPHQHETPRQRPHLAYACCSGSQACQTPRAVPQRAFIISQHCCYGAVAGPPRDRCNRTCTYSVGTLAESTLPVPYLLASPTGIGIASSTGTLVASTRPPSPTISHQLPPAPTSLHPIIIPTLALAGESRLPWATFCYQLCVYSHSIFFFILYLICLSCSGPCEASAYL
jgi:hypothetical protein